MAQAIVPETPEPSSGELSEENKHLLQALLEQSKGFATAVLLVAGAALSLSMTAFTKLSIQDAVKLDGVGWLKAAWIALGVAMLVQVFTILTSIHAIRKTLETGAYKTAWGTWTERLNWAIAIVLALGFGGLFVFAFMNVG